MTQTTKEADEKAARESAFFSTGHFDSHVQGFIAGCAHKQTELEARLAVAEKALEMSLDLAVSGYVDYKEYKLKCDNDIAVTIRTALAKLRGEKQL